MSGRHAAHLLPARGPARTMGLATLINTTGDGLLLAGGVIFFTSDIGLSARQVGFGLTAAGLVGLLVSVPIGKICDQHGARETLLVLLSFQAVLMGCYVLVRSFPGFILVASGGAVGVAGAAPARGALVAVLGRTTPGGRVVLRGYLRSMTNTGVAVGALGAGLVVALGSRPAYLAMVLTDAATYLVAALLISRLPPTKPTPAGRSERRWTALRDTSYLAVSAVSGVMSLQYDVLPVALPLWITLRTSAPHAVTGPLLFINAAMVATQQTRVARRISTIARASSAVRSAGVVFATACLVFAATRYAVAALAVIGLLIGVVVHTRGELLHAAGGFGLSFDLAAPSAQGQYQAVFGLGISGARALAPAVLSGLVVGMGIAGWAILAGIFMAAGLLVIPTARWSEKSRPSMPP
jgi:MFS family permease